MKSVKYEEAKDNLNSLLNRESDPGEGVRDRVLEIIDQVRKKGDEALFYYTKEFDKADLADLKVSQEEIENAVNELDDKLLAVYKEAADNIRSFHEKQKEESWHYQARPGVVLGQQITPIERVGIYVPGGKAAYPSTVLMDSIPAKVAGVESLAMVTPPGPDGKIDPHILAAAKIAGVDEIYKVGGAQGVAALAYGTESIKPVHKIVGPGNIYVATAKKEVFGKVDIDMIAGPSEVLIIADKQASPSYIAADLLAQAEHDEMAMPILITDDKSLVGKVNEELEIQINQDINRKDIAKKSVDDYGLILTTDTIDQAIELANEIAPEHLELMVEEPENYYKKIRNAGAIFLGPFTPEPVGDYFAGPNHTLPTSGTAKFSSPLGVYDFQKRSSLLSYDKAALENIGNSVMNFAKSEGLDAHANSVSQRLNKE